MDIVVGIWIANPTGCTVGSPCPEYDNSPEYVNAWVDWDGDKVFETNEKVLDQAGTGYANLNYSGRMSFHKRVTVPDDAASSVYMRVNLGWDHDPNDPCEQYWTWGDIEDYEIDFAAWRKDVQLQPGDLLLHRKLGVIAPFGYWTHVGIYVGGGQLVEAVPSEGVKYSYIWEWDFPRDTTVKVLRVSGATKTIRDKVVDFVKAQANANKSYDSKLWQKDDDPNSESWYCSELAWAAYKNQGIDIEYTPDFWVVSPDEISDDGDTYRVSAHGRMEDGTTYAQDTEPKALLITAHSPVDIVVTDPDGLIFTKYQQEIPLGTYIESDIDGDGDVEDLVVIAETKIGDYLIGIVAEPGASPTATYTLEVSAYGITVTLAENVQIADIPSEPYVIESLTSAMLLPSPILPATIDVDPNTLRLGSKGTWMTGYIELPNGDDVREIAIASVNLNGMIPAENSHQYGFVTHPQIADRDGDGRPELMVKFSRSAVQAILDAGDQVELTVAGNLTDGTPFTGTDFIRVTD